MGDEIEGRVIGRPKEETQEEKRISRKNSDFSWGHVLFARAVRTTYHRLGGLDNRNVFDHNSGS